MKTLKRADSVPCRIQETQGGIKVVGPSAEISPATSRATALSLPMVSEWLKCGICRATSGNELRTATVNSWLTPASAGIGISATVQSGDVMASGRSPISLFLVFDRAPASLGQSSGQGASSIADGAGWGPTVCSCAGGSLVGNYGKSLKMGNVIVR